jgi:hypothetical protein
MADANEWLAANIELEVMACSNLCAGPATARLLVRADRQRGLATVSWARFGCCWD